MSSRPAASRGTRRCRASGSWPASSASIRTPWRARSRISSGAGTWRRAAARACSWPRRSSPRPSLTHREDFLKDTVIRAAALGMTPDDVAAGVLSVAGLGVAAPSRDRRGPPHRVQRAGARLLWTGAPGSPAGPMWPRCSSRTWRPPCGGKRGLGHWAAAVTSFGHLPEVERHLDGQGVPVLALLAEAHLETLQRLAQLPPGTRSAWSPPPWRPPTPWSTRSPPPPCRTSRGSRPARPRGVR